jgi:hypothetical protein
LPEKECLALDDAPSAISAAEILKKTDEKRAPWPDFSMSARLVFTKFGESRQDVFRVFVKNYTKTLVSYIEPVKQRGNMLLMLDEDLWYYVNKTQRPMRITPIQRLSGGASYGDISRLNWSGDYAAEYAGEDTVTIEGVNYDTWRLLLKARSRSATYNTVDLYIEKGSYCPRKAVVYLQSGKKMKTMYFSEYRNISGKVMNTRIAFVDHLASDSVTTLVFSNVSLRKYPDRYFLKTSLPSLYGEVVF